MPERPELAHHGWTLLTVPIESAAGLGPRNLNRLLTRLFPPPFQQPPPSPCYGGINRPPDERTLRIFLGARRKVLWMRECREGHVQYPASLWPIRFDAPSPIRRPRQKQPDSALGAKAGIQGSALMPVRK